MTDDWKPWPPNYPSPLVDPDSARKAMKLPTSYPFLALSIVRNVPYCLVLAYADLCARPILYDDPNRPLTDQMLAAKARLDTQTKIIINDAVVNGVDRLAAQVPRIAP